MLIGSRALDDKEIPVQLIAGLGNPGAEYSETRHNAGFWFADELASAWQGQFRNEQKFQGEVCKLVANGQDVWLLKPMTWMNRSGQAVAALARYYKIPPAAVLVVHDELDLPAGTARLKRGGGHGGHNGLRDLIQHLGKDFARLRIGIGHPGHKDQVHDYVLGRPSRADHQQIEDAIWQATKILPKLLEHGLEKAMNELHTK